MKIKIKRLIEFDDLDSTKPGTKSLTLFRIGKRTEPWFYVATVWTVSKDAYTGMWEAVMSVSDGKRHYGSNSVDTAVNAANDSEAIDWAVDEWRRVCGDEVK